MAKTGIVRDNRYLEHETGSYHVENPQRLVHIYKALDEIESPLEEITPRAATREEITAVHDPEYVDRIAATAGKEARHLDPDTVTSPKTYEVALLAAGGLLAAIDAVMGDLANAFALVRPPGHHAEGDRAMQIIMNVKEDLAANLFDPQLGVAYHRRWEEVHLTREGTARATGAALEAEVYILPAQLFDLGFEGSVLRSECEVKFRRPV